MQELRQRLAEAGASAEEVLACRPDATSPECLRELAAIYRWAGDMAGPGKAAQFPAVHRTWQCSDLHQPEKPPFHPFLPIPCLLSTCRSDLTLVCSPAEMQLLTQHCGVPASKLALAPFFAPPSPHAAVGGGPAFAERRHIAMIGNWRHPPNLDSARWACSEVWPALRAALPPEHRDAELHLYGAYAAGAAQQLHRPVSARHGQREV